MEFIKTYGDGEPHLDYRPSENNISFMEHENKNKLQISKVYNLKSFFETSHISLVCHKEFLSELDSGNIYCKVCSINLDSVLELSEHLQTKSHEDSIILLIKSNLPPSLRKCMEFITFYDSNLYCNLCKCNISWSSENPFKTIVDVIAHNESSDHVQKKTINKVPPGLQNNDDSLTVLKTLAAGDSLLGNNISFIDYKVQPMYQCKLCIKVIEFEENQSQMLINFSLHLNSEGHKKCFKTYMVLKSFEESHLSRVKSSHSLSVVKDRIFCSCSSRSRPIHPSEESLLAHVSEKSDDDLDNGTLSSELNSIILEEPKYPVPSFLSTSSTENFLERYDQTESLFIKAPLEHNGDNHSIHGSVAVNNKYVNPNNTVPEVKSKMNNYVRNEVSSDVYDALDKLKQKDFFVSKVFKYLAKLSNKVTCDVCDAIICSSSDEKTLKDSIKHHFVGEKHKNFMEKLTFDEKETVVKLTFENATVEAHKQYIKASGKYLHCILCQFSLTLCLDHESLQKKLITHCLSRSHLEEIGKPYNSAFETRPSSSQSTATLPDDNPVKQLNTSPIKHSGSDEKVNHKNGDKEVSSWMKLASGDGKHHYPDAASFRESLRNDPNAIKISNINPDSAQKPFMTLVKSFGPVRHFHFSKDPKTGLCNGYAFVHYQTNEAARKAKSALCSLPTKYGNLAVDWAYKTKV